MGFSGGGENIAIGITTTSDLTGTTAARTDVTALGKATTAATQEIVQATTAAATAENTLAVAAEKATTSGGKLVVSAVQMREALAATGGDLTKAAKLLATVAATEAEATIAATALAAATAKVQVATAAAVVTESKEAVVLAEVIAATEARTASLAKEDGVRTASMGKIPGQARTAANALSILTQAAVTSGGSMAGIANSAGGLAFGLSAMVPELALAAAGIGALVTVAVALYEAFSRDSGKVADFTGELIGSLDQVSGKSSAIVAASQLQVDTQLNETRQKIVAQKALLDSMTTKVFTVSTTDVVKARADLKDLEEAEKQFRERAEKLDDLFRQAKGREDDDAAAKARQRAEDELRARERDAQRALAIEAQMIESRQSAIDKTTLTQDEAASAKVVRDERRREEEIRALKISEDEKTRLILLAQEDRDAQLAGIAKAGRDRQAEEQRRADEKEQHARDEMVKKQQDAVMKLFDASNTALETAIKAHESAASILTKAALAPIVAELNALAESEAIKAIAHFASGDFWGGAAHTVASGLATAAAAKVGNQAGLNSSGGSASTSSAGGGGGSTFTPKEKQGGGDTVVNLFTTDPYSHENIMIASYNLQRAGITKRPLYLPPTTGLRS